MSARRVGHGVASTISNRFVALCTSTARGAVRLGMAVLLLFTAGTSNAATLHVMVSAGFADAWRLLAPSFERQTGEPLITAPGSADPDSANAIPQRLLRGQQADVLILPGSEMDALIRKGIVMPGSRIEIARAPIGIAVPFGASRPDIRTMSGLRKALRDARVVAYPDEEAAFIMQTLLPQLGISEAMKGRLLKVSGQPVGAVVARGQADVGIDAVNRLKPLMGLEFLGPLPDAVQTGASFAAAIPTKATPPYAGRALIEFLGSPAAAADISRAGLEPVRVRR